MAKDAEFSSTAAAHEEIRKLILHISDDLNSHVPGSASYIAQEMDLSHAVQYCLGVTTQGEDAVPFFEIAQNAIIYWPFQKMGSVSSADLVRLDEIIMFNYYVRMRDYYDVALDLGANLGLHTLVFSKLGYRVNAFEPDPLHFEALMRNLALNKSEKVSVHKTAVSDKAGTSKFLRVEGNTTSSHLLGAKEAPYGELTELVVECVAFEDIVDPNLRTLAKIDIEGQEAIVISSLPRTLWQTLDAFVEVGTSKNAKVIFDYCENQGINIFAQRISWNRVTRFDEMPMDYHGGSIFISCASEMKWN